jgi:hypothetical protein
VKAGIFVQVDSPVEVGDRREQMRLGLRVESLYWTARLRRGCEDGREHEREDECVLGRGRVRRPWPLETVTVQVQQIACYRGLGGRHDTDDGRSASLQKVAGQQPERAMSGQADEVEEGSGVSLTPPRTERGQLPIPNKASRSELSSRKEGHEIVKNRNKRKRSKPVNSIQCGRPWNDHLRRATPASMPSPRATLHKSTRPCQSYISVPSTCPVRPTRRSPCRPRFRISPPGSPPCGWPTAASRPWTNPVRMRSEAGRLLTARAVREVGV